MVLHRPIETTVLTVHVDSSFRLPVWSPDSTDAKRQQTAWLSRQQRTEVWIALPIASRAQINLRLILFAPSKACPSFDALAD